MTAAMPSSTGIRVLLATLLAISCRDRGAAGPSTDELSKLSPEMFSHADEASVEDSRCLAVDGILISPSSIGPIRLGRKLESLRQSCAVATVKVPASAGITGPVFGVSASGGLILFTIAGRDSAIETAGTSNPGFRTPRGVGVGSSVREIPAGPSTICFKHDSVRVTEVLISRRRLKC
jgi:hypothetical protein